MSNQSIVYAVLNEPYCLWDADSRSRNLSFLKGIDAEYFSYLAKIMGDELSGKETRMRAAASIRLGFYHGIETLFLLLGALLQAPDCVYAWITQCTPSQLRELLKKINESDSELLKKLRIEPLSWDQISKAVMIYSNPDKNKAERNCELFGLLWKRLAHEYLNENQIMEYNSLKHGFRVGHGGFSLSVGSEHKPGVSPLPEEFTLLGRSDFGSRFYVIERVGGEKKSNKSRASKQVFMNWNVEGSAAALQLIAMSIRNVVSALQILNGTNASEVRFTRPIDDNDFDKPWEDPPGVQNMNINAPRSKKGIRSTTKEKLLGLWRQIDV